MVTENKPFHRENNTLNVFWVGVLLIALAVAAPWFNLTVSSPELMKSYIASFGVSLLMFLSLYYKCNNSEVQLKINHIKSSLLLLLILEHSALYGV